MSDNTALEQLPRTAAEVARQTNQYDMGRHRASWQELVRLKQAADESKKAYETYRDRFKGIVGDADEIVLDGEIVATHAISSKFNSAQFRKTYPDIAAEFTVTKTVEVIDEDALREQHPWLYQNSRSRALRFKEN